MMSNIPYQDDILQFACDSLFSLPIDSMSLNQYPIEYDDAKHFFVEMHSEIW